MAITRLFTDDDGTSLECFRNISGKIAIRIVGEENTPEGSAMLCIALDDDEICVLIDELNILIDEPIS